VETLNPAQSINQSINQSVSQSVSQSINPLFPSMPVTLSCISGELHLVYRREVVWYL